MGFLILSNAHDSVPLLARNRGDRNLTDVRGSWSIWRRSDQYIWKGGKPLLIAYLPERISGYFSYILGPFWMPLPQINQKSTSLKLHILTSSPLFDREQISPYFELKITNTCFRSFEHFKQQRTNPKVFFKICLYIQKMTLNLIETLKTSIYSPNDTKNTKIHSENFKIFKLKNLYFSKL
jgi:hypothetical protein